MKHVKPTVISIKLGSNAPFKYSYNGKLTLMTLHKQYMFMKDDVIAPRMRLNGEYDLPLTRTVNTGDSVAIINWDTQINSLPKIEKPSINYTSMPNVEDICKTAIHYSTIVQDAIVRHHGPFRSEGNDAMVDRCIAKFKAKS